MIESGFCPECLILPTPDGLIVLMIEHRHVVVLAVAGETFAQVVSDVAIPWTPLLSGDRSPPPLSGGGIDHFCLVRAQCDT